MSTRPGRFALASVMVVASVGLGACGGDDGSSSAGATTTAVTAAPEDRIAPDAEVGAGLVRLKGVAAKVAGAANGAEAKRAAEGLEPVWQPIEGTVKKNEPDLYLDVEDSFQRLESGNRANAKKGAEALDAAVDAYVAKHPS